MLVRDMEDSIKTYQKKLDEMTADRIKLRNDSHEREKEAEHVRLSIRRELDGVKAALGEAQFQSGKLSSQNQDLTKDILDLQALLANANAKTVEAERKAEKSNNKALQSEKMLIGLQSDLACLVDRFVHRS
ncbi:hypothetical protein B0H10DRAFT_1290308 [Mycena sp. CBHHK59/15]|nr:hypothetical protein B0H10DRAFT_1290308 [Mycena sp. CBHHK59/15]